MFFIISKIFKWLIFPLSWIIILLVVGFFLRNRRWRIGLFIAAMLLLVIFTNKPLLNYAQYQYTKSFMQTNVLPQQHYEVAIVMDGFGQQMDTVTGQLCYYRDRGSRLWEPIRLVREGVVDKILITGDQTIAINKDSSSTATYFMAYMEQMGITDSCLLLEQRARNTIENARYSVAILDSLGYTANDCLLVTSASHQRRTLQCFESEGWTPTPYAVNIYPKPGPTHFQDWMPSGETLSDWNELINEWIGGIIYRLTF